MTRPTFCGYCGGPLARRPWWCRWLPPLPLCTGPHVAACIRRHRRLVGC